MSRTFWNHMNEKGELRENCGDIATTKCNNLFHAVFNISIQSGHFFFCKSSDCHGCKHTQSLSRLAFGLHLRSGCALRRLVQIEEKNSARSPTQFDAANVMTFQDRVQQFWAKKGILLEISPPEPLTKLDDDPTDLD